MFLMRYFERIRPVTSGSARIAERIARSPAAITGSDSASCSSAFAAPVSTTVPEGSTRVIERSVR